MSHHKIVLHDILSLSNKELFICHQHQNYIHQTTSKAFDKGHNAVPIFLFCILVVYCSVCFMYLRLLYTVKHLRGGFSFNRESFSFAAYGKYYGTYLYA